MDPSPIRLSSLTLLSTVAAAVKKIESLRDADKSLRAVLEDLSDFQMLVRQSNTLVDQDQAEIPEVQRANLARLLERAEAKLREWDGIVESVMQKGVEEVVKAKKLQWARRESKVAKLQMGINDLKLTLGILLNSISTSCCLRLQTTLVGSGIQNTHISLGRQTKQAFARQEVMTSSLFSGTNLSSISIRPKLDPPRLDNAGPKGGMEARQSSSRCIFLRERKSNPMCLYCSKVAMAITYKRQPAIRNNLLEKSSFFQVKHTTLPGTTLSEVSSWHTDTRKIFIKVLPEHNIPNLELRVREFRPSSHFEPYTFWRTFDDKLELLPPRTVRTRPYAIPYAEYVENRPGRSLLSILGLEGKMVFRNNRLVDAAFTFAALSWVATSHVFATGDIKDTTIDSSGSAAAPSKNNSRHPNVQRDPPHGEDSLKHASYSQPRKFADDERNGISSCPIAINSQLSLLCLERAREIEHDILAGLQTLMFGQHKNTTIDAERLFVPYISLALMMDAYEKFLTRFEDLRQREQFGRCLHLVESLTAELGFLLRGATMLDFLNEVAGGEGEENSLAQLASKMWLELLADDNRLFWSSRPYL
ncbi:hypothetical protein N431DRAFT_489275 [Stipitochalara longipes BDJ]|nr:hypothetical protein N431DRAFT_489275 [Stipitochalara longipes BDJ]